MGDRFPGARVLAADRAVQGGEGTMGGGGEQIGKADWRLQPEVALPVLRPRPTILAAVREAEEEAGYFRRGQLRMRLRQPIARAAVGSEIARISGILSGDDENAARHAKSVK